MLLTKNVMVKWNSKIKKWYINKGYKFTKMGNEFKVKVEDLTNGSHIYVEVKCDCKDCESPYLKPIIWQNYLKHVKEDGSYYCHDCAIRLYGNEKHSKTILKNGTSFEQWCIENNRQDILDRWDYELNKCDPSDINYSTHKKYYFKCPRGIHDSELKDICSFTSGHEGSMYCKQCNSFAQWGYDNVDNKFLEKYWDYDKNKGNSPWEIDYGSKKKVWIKCQKKEYHDSYNISCNSFLEGNRCIYCKGDKIHPLDSLGKLLEDKGLLEIWSNKNKKSPYEYSPNSAIKAWWKCSEGKHEDYYRRISDSNTYNFRCPECVQERNESFLQEKVRLYLESLNNGKYTILHENKCTIVPQNPKTKHILPFDNEIKELKLIIEVHGQQHYKICSWHKKLAKKHNTISKYELHYQQLKDRYKKYIAYIKGYNYIAIPYGVDDGEGTWKQLIDNKIKEIIDN